MGVGATRKGGGSPCRRLGGGAVAVLVLGLGLGLAASAPAGASAVRDCPSGPRLVGALAGDLGPAPEGGVTLTCLEVVNDRPVERLEVASAGIPLPRELGLLTPEGLVVVGPEGRRHAAQLDVLSRWGGPVDDPTRPIRWLQVSAPVRVTANGATLLALRRHAGGAPAAADPFATGIDPVRGGAIVDTGVARFTLDPASPALIAEIDAAPGDDGRGFRQVYRHTAGAGPRLVLPASSPGGAPLDLSTAVPGAVVVDPGGFEIVARGPVRVVVALSGHFSAAAGATLCTRNGLSYERFGFTAVATFTRGSRDVELAYHLSNECSDALGGPWTDDAVTIVRASWELPFGITTPEIYAAGGGQVAQRTGDVRVEQAKGAGAPWRRRARVIAGGATVETAEAFDRPLVAVGGEGWLAAVQLGWMRYREPQALTATAAGARLSFEVVSEPLVVGEGKGLWNLARLAIRPLPATGGGPAAQPVAALAAIREGSDALERGLLVRPRLSFLNRSRVFPSLGRGRPSLLANEYRSLLAELHRQTVAPGGQWDRAKTFGSQLWPDVQADLWLIDHPSPAANSGAMNYWNASGAELLEFLRSGEPRWAWDFALPQSWLQAHTAYLNTGARSHIIRAGFAVTSGGTGEGHWHRSAFGSDDYSYAMGLHLAYVLRPDPVLRDAFARAGRTAVGRYAVPEANEAGRERFVDQVDVVRQVVQHYWLLADCAEFVPGEQGRACHDKLLEVVDELTRDNLRAGVMCVGDDPLPRGCSAPQQFMQNALLYPFFDRVWRNYGDVLGSSGERLGKALAGIGRTLYTWGIPKRSDGRSIAVTGPWAAGLDCTLDPGGPDGDSVTACMPAPDSDGNFAMFRPNKPHTLALVLMAHEVDPSLALCEIARAAYDDPALTAGWGEFVANESGWWKGAAQMVQGMAFAVGLYDTCRDAGSPPRLRPKGPPAG